MKHVGTQEFESNRLIFRRFQLNDDEEMFNNWASKPDIQSEHGEPTYDTIEKVNQLVKKYVENYYNSDFLPLGNY